MEIIFSPNPEDVPEIMRRTELILGQPFVKIPEHRRSKEHEVLAVIDGNKIRRAEIEMVFNDTISMDFAYALTGKKSEDFDAIGSPMQQIRSLAFDIYGEFGKQIKQEYGVICLECSQDLPNHLELCEAGKKWKMFNEKRNSNL